MILALQDPEIQDPNLLKRLFLKREKEILTSHSAQDPKRDLLPGVKGIRTVQRL